MIRLAASEGLEIQQFPPNYTNRIHRDDVAAALMHLLLLDDPQALYLVSDDLPVAKYDVLAWIATALGKPTPKGLSTDSGSGGKRIDNQRLRRSGFRLNYAGYGGILEVRSTSEHSK